MSTPKPPPSHFTILYFAAASSYTRRSHDFLPAPLPITQLFDLLEEKYPGMKRKVLESCAVTVNLEYVDLEEMEEMQKKDAEDGLVVTLRGSDEVGIIPPVSSG